jgi:hypothetical protein
MTTGSLLICLHSGLCLVCSVVYLSELNSVFCIRIQGNACWPPVPPIHGHVYHTATSWFPRIYLHGNVFAGSFPSNGPICHNINYNSLKSTRIKQGRMADSGKYGKELSVSTKHCRLLGWRSNSWFLSRALLHGVSWTVTVYSYWVLSWFYSVFQENFWILRYAVA